MPEEKTFSAFLSYSSKNKLYAWWLRHMLEGYTVPCGLRRKRPDLPKHISMIFRDVEDLGPGLIPDKIKDGIKRSPKLIVVCSPHAVESKWVSEEIKIFKESHNEKDVIPVLRSGSIENAYPERISHETLYFDKFKRYDRLKIIAELLGLKDVSELEPHDKQRQRIRFIAVVLLIAVIVALVVTINHQHRESLAGQIDLLLANAQNAVATNDRLAGMRYSLDALEIYDNLYPEGNAETSELIRQTLESTVYSQPFQLLAPIQNNSRRFGRVDFSPDDTLILGSLGDNAAVVIDAHTGETLQTITRKRPYDDNYLMFLEFSPSGKYFATGFGAYTSEIIVWRTDVNPVEIASHYAEYNSVTGCFLSDSELIFGRIASDDEVAIWDFGSDVAYKPTEAQIYAFYRDPPQWASGEKPNGWVREPDGMDILFAFSHDGQRIIAGNMAGFCGIFASPSSATTDIIDNYDEAVYQYPTYFESLTNNLSISTNHVYDRDLYPYDRMYLLNEPSGRFLAIVHPDCFVELWDLSKDRVNPAYGFQEHIGTISKAYMTSEYLVTGGLDGRLMVFNLADGSLRNSVEIKDGIIALNLDPTGTRAIALAKSATVAYVYDITTGLLLYRLDAEPDDLIDCAGIGFSEKGNLAIAKQESGRTIVGTVFLSLDELINYAKSVVN